jgi:hypothetical protein
MKKEHWLRISYWVAAIADWVIAVLAIIRVLIGPDDYSYTVGIVAAVGLCWGIMLTFADRKPVERKWMLYPTLLVVFLITLVYLHAVITGIYSFGFGLFAVIAGGIIFIIILYSLWINRKLSY